MNIKVDSNTLLILAVIGFLLIAAFDLNGLWILVPFGLIIWSIIKSAGGRNG